MSPARVIVLGGGLAGMAAAWNLASAGLRVTVVERGPELGGLAGTFEREGHFYPLGYHHILHRDRTLLFALDRIGELPSVRWRKIRMLFRLHGRAYDLAHPIDFARFPMRFLDKLAFVRLMLRAFNRSDWSGWQGRTARELVESWGSRGVREVLFEPLARLKFDLSTAEVSAAWLGARLQFREGSAPLGYIPGDNWTRRLCDGMTTLLQSVGVETRLRSTVTGLLTTQQRIAEIELDDGERLDADFVVSTLPTETYMKLVGEDASDGLQSIRYTALLSAIAATPTVFAPDFYWMNMASLNRTACGIFRLESLNPSIGAADETTLNFVTHLPGRDHPLFALDDDAIWKRYDDDFEGIFGKRFEPRWRQLNRVAMYSPIFDRGYRNPPVRSASWRNVYFAGNYRTFPSVASTGTAMESGLDAATALLADDGDENPLAGAASRFKLRSMPRG